MNTTKTEKRLVIAGRVLTVLIALPFVISAAMKFLGKPEVAEGMIHLGWPESMIRTLAILELGSTILYLIPQTAILGAILLTGYLGGAIATHLRIGEGVGLHVFFGVVFWAALFLREPKLRQILPLRKV